jgi:hypothetical protein
VVWAKYGVWVLAGIGIVVAVTIIVGRCTIWALAHGTAPSGSPFQELFTPGEIPAGPGVYLLGQDTTGDGTIDRVKIGEGQNMLSRVRAGRTWSSFPLVEIGYCGTTAHETLETELHDLYRAHAVRGQVRRGEPRGGRDWFEVSGRLARDLEAFGVLVPELERGTVR